MLDVTVPALTTVDRACQLVRWLVVDGQDVRVGDTLAVLETGKASYDLPAGIDGRVEALAPAGTWVEYGAVVCRLVPAPGASRATTPATAWRAAAGAPDGAAIGGARSRNQEAVARTVELSHRTIPASFVLMKVPCEAALQSLRRYSAAHRALVGLVELLVLALARLGDEFPQLCGRVAEPRDAGGPAIGVTIDVGKGLFIPVVRGARGKTLQAIAAELVDLRRRAYHGSFAAEDLAGADLSLSINSGEGIVFAQPFVYPGQACMLSLGGTLEEWDRAGACSRVVHIGIAYDHRVANGQDAARFLAAIRGAIEECDALLA